MKCTHCPAESPEKITEVIHSNGTKHLRVECADCGKFLGYKRQNIIARNFLMPFGKYKDKTVGWIFENDLNYFNWAKDKLRGAVQDRFMEVGLEKSI